MVIFFMKNFSSFVFVFLIIFLISTDANARGYKVNDVVEKQFIMNKKFKLNLPEGEWVVADRNLYTYYNLVIKIFSIVRLENNNIVEWIEVAEMKTVGLPEHIVNRALMDILFANKYDGCYERPEYFAIKVYKKGNTHNCLVIDHSDVQKDFYTPDDPDNTNARLKKWIKDNNIQLPSVGLSSFHSYFSRLAGGRWYLLEYGIDPNILNAPKNQFISEETSEYHKNNISNYPEHQKIMQKWVSISAKRHIEFEDSIKALERHKLDLNSLSPSTSASSKNLSNDILDQINKLHDLYKSGVLTKDEFEKAKKKILN